MYRASGLVPTAPREGCAARGSRARAAALGPIAETILPLLKLERRRGSTKEFLGCAREAYARGWAAVTMSDDLAVSSAGFAKAVRDLRYAGLVRETTRKGRYAANPQ